MAYYSFQRRKLTSLNLKVKAKGSFLLGNLLLQLLKEKNLYEKRNTRSLEISNIIDRALGGDCKLDFFRAFFSKSSRAILL